MKKNAIIILAIISIALTPSFAATVNNDAKMHKFSTVIEKERPELDEETKRLISEYRRNPTEANRAALRKQVEKRYDAVVARKKAKLEELKRTAKDKSKVEEMQVIVDEMLRDRENRIEQSMKRFADPRLKPDARNAKDGFLPVIGSAQNLSIAYAPVTNYEYAAFLKATGRKAPKDWKDDAFSSGKAHHPVVSITYDDAVAYCAWLTAKDSQAKYRLPTANEWEVAAGHMPKDADFNCGAIASSNCANTPTDCLNGESMYWPTMFRRLPMFAAALARFSRRFSLLASAFLSGSSLATSCTTACPAFMFFMSGILEI